MGLRTIGGEGKGINIAAEIAQATKRKLIVAGPGVWTDAEKYPHVETVGFVNGEQRAKLLAGADAVLTPSLFVEPFCGVAVEAMLSGAPVICTDWGAFTENVVHGVTGWRCRTFEQFTWAVDHIGDLSRRSCRDWAVNNFSMLRVSDMYEEYWRMVRDIVDFKSQQGGWYEPREDRIDLGWLRRYYPPQLPRLIEHHQEAAE
jgi:glycosyltransferase involved in cell wall biosynthesis